ncbi:TetR family transcriptional regulator [Vibrio salinus]|uniref:TetR family transcriptional regulator n=1 Tax=Vibrio salinus TaxID=2899784 RepID=UPI001E3D78AB|nr:TetR family transcriptional regulator [Vibrio salinus]MCE0495295.1 TetR family transcriptional regulator [Vibrio salinus]
MNKPQSPALTSRKTPQQSRSSELVASILEAAIQILKSEGIRRFTTARVAERAGVSVGSLYQYFPNKAAILFQLQSDEWQETSNLLQRILEDHSLSHADRLNKLVYSFIHSECEESDIRTALHDAAPLYRNSPEAKKAKQSSEQISLKFLKELAPDIPESDSQMINDVIITTLGSVGKSYSSQPRSPIEMQEFSKHIASMLTAYLEELGINIRSS